MMNTPPLARRDDIGRRLDEGHAVSAADLAIEFDVSEDAIRRDLRTLAAQGRCRRVYGGALPLSPASTPISTRMREGKDNKRNLAAAALPLIQPGELLFLDNGSTNLALATMLPTDIGISVATNAIAIAAAVLALGDIPVIMIGGPVDPDVGGCVGAAATLAVQQLNIDRTFLGTCALSIDEGLGAFDSDDAIFKRALVDVSRQIVVMATTEKLETRARHRIAPLSRLSALVVEQDAISAVPHLAAAAATQLLIAPSNP
ncbi:DeoR/GlpR family DNA-binding transcription regulator [Novosphingobium rosa]|uniref:DeoR/GlpR family DNA-binding transcription regulator n=1 Tax=Novosphingobium rosa TaxID=76978 RepID=UPI000834B0BB|nr:DeoR/GlpR family DNA-binding transcription regulator [Novosphingobium rosa]